MIIAQHKSPQEPEPPLEIDCDQVVELVVRRGVPEQFHKFDRTSALAIEAALAACRPLLVRGEPGVGKTQLAAAAARVLKRPLVQKVVDSRTESGDLLWEYDAVMRLAEAQVAGALGSILLGQSEHDPAASMPGHAHHTLIDRLRSDLDAARFVRPGPLWWAFDWDDATIQARKSSAAVPLLPEWADPANGCVVLIDEIDKAEADVPNGLLEALGAGEFTPLGREKPVQVRDNFPLVVITTNEERMLPSAFVRRCLVLRLELPRRESELIEFLVDRALVHFPDYAANEKAIELLRVAEQVVHDRQDAKDRGISPRPGQAEYLDLVRALKKLAPGSPDEQLLLLPELSAYALRKNECPSE
jgi:MoxR-like ATPase